MKYILFTDKKEAEVYKIKLQDQHNKATSVGKPKIIDSVVVTYNGKFACTLQDSDKTWPDVGNGEIVDSIEPPVQEDII